MTSTLERLLRQLGFLALLAVVNPACGGGTGQSGPAPLFQDFFNGTVLGTGWSAPATTGSATATIDQTVGAPLPSLKMTTTAATSDTVSTSTTMSFNNPLVTFEVSMADISTATSQIGTGTITILDATPASIATASWSNATGQITFHINGGTDATTGALAADGTFHALVFSVNSAGVGSWSLDNAAAVVVQPVAAGKLTLQLGASFGTGTAWPAFYFDNVTVTSP